MVRLFSNTMCLLGHGLGMATSAALRSAEAQKAMRVLIETTWPVG